MNAYAQIHPLLLSQAIQDSAHLPTLAASLPSESQTFLATNLLLMAPHHSTIAILPSQLLLTRYLPLSTAHLT